MGPADAGYGVFTECTHMHCSLCHMQGVILDSEVYEEAKNRKKNRLCVFLSLFCLLLAGFLSVAGMGFRNFHSRLFAVSHLHIEDSLTW